MKKAFCDSDTASLFDKDKDTQEVEYVKNQAPKLTRDNFSLSDTDLGAENVPRSGAPAPPTGCSFWRPHSYPRPPAPGRTITEMIAESIHFQCEQCGDMFRLDSGWSMLDMGEKTGICERCKNLPPQPVVHEEQAA